MPGPIASAGLSAGIAAPATAQERRLLAEARAFESVLLSFLTRELTAAVVPAGPAGGVYGQLLGEQLAGALAEGGGVGIAGLVYGQLAQRSASS